MATFEDLDFPQRYVDGLTNQGQSHFFFDNGYGVSVVRGPFSYGGPEGKFELAVLRGDKNNHEITYDTPITDDVEGYLSKSQVTALLEEIEKLPAA